MRGSRVKEIANGNYKLVKSDDWQNGDHRQIEQVPISQTQRLLLKKSWLH